MFSFDPSIFALVLSSLAVSQKLVRTLHDQLKIIEEIEKNPGEKRVDIVNDLRCPLAH
jgi:hypothetical protein